jgi:Uma2 family endonuclease
MGSSAGQHRPARYEDLLKLPEHVVGEIIAGELHATPRPAGLHTLAASALGGSLGPPFQFGDGGPGGWWILDEPELHLRDDVLVPDLAGWRRERMPAPPAGAYFDVSPDWVCEVLSPATRRLDRVHKLPLYAAARVWHLWLVDPEARTLEVYRRESNLWVLVATHGDDARVRAEPFADVELDLLRLWGQERPADR